MIDCIVPVHHSFAHKAAMDTIPALADVTDVPVRFIISARGGTTDDWHIVRHLLDSLRDEEGLHYGLMSRSARVGTMFDAVSDVLDSIKHDHVFIMQPQVRIKDKMWFAKMLKVRTHAPYVGGVFLPSESFESAALDPVPLSEPTRIYETSAVLTTRDHLEMVRPIHANRNQQTFEEAFQSSIVRFGSERWSHPGVVFNNVAQANWSQR